jgi:alpha-beta hydrolase superfamily lysophospholipase
VNFVIGKRQFQRTDIELVNERNFKIQCSHFEPINQERVAEKLPCVIYCHGNCSSRLESFIPASTLLPQNITLFTFDFSGCGHSEGDYISLGWHEKDDLQMIINHLRSTDRVSLIGLWGRSMGAVTSILQASRDPTIAGIVLDSPFYNLNKLALELVKTYTKIP